MSPWPPEGEPSGKGTKPVTLPRPGHADLAGVLKYGHDDVRDALERASARHTAVHVAAGAVAKALLATIGIAVRGATVDEEALRASIDEARKERDTVGGVVEVRATGVPPGLGSYATKDDRLDARLAFALMGIQAVKGVEIGDGFALAALRGSQAHDEIRTDRRRDTNHAGGIEAGISNGEEIVVRAAMKPLPTLMKPLGSVDLQTGEAATALVERSDVAAVEALAVVAEAAVAWELAVLREGQVRRRRGRRLRRRARARTSSASTWQLNALDRHLALIGFMGAGKTTLAEAVAARHRPARGRRRPPARGSRRRSRSARSSRSGARPSSASPRRALARDTFRAVAAGGGRARRRRGEDARGAARRCASARSRCSSTSMSTTAWARAKDTDRPLAQDEQHFRRLYDERQPLYRERRRRGRATTLTG